MRAHSVLVPLLVGLLALSGCDRAADAPKPLATAKAKPTDLPAPSDVAAPPPDAVTTKSGLSYKVLTLGTGGEHPVAEDRVEVHYTGWTTDGKMFDSSVVRGNTTKFKLTQVIKGWTEGVQLMTVGEKTRFWIPSELAYADKQGKPAGMLVFDVELKGIQAAPKPILAPDDVAAAPRHATKTASGLAYMVLTPGTGKVHPKASDTVEVHYTGWSIDGKMFDSSVVRKKTASFPLNGVIKGWTEGVQLMVEGEKTRFWIPADLAYGDTPMKPGAPSGNLTFDIELHTIQAE